MMTQERRPPARPAYIDSALDDAGLNPSQFRVYTHLCRRADNHTGEANCGVLGMAEHCHMHHETVRASLKELMARNMIEAIDRSGQTRIYRLTHPETWVYPPGNEVGVGKSGPTSFSTHRKIIEVPPTLFSGDTPLEIRKAKVLPEGTPEKVLPPNGPIAAQPNEALGAAPALPAGTAEEDEEKKAENERRKLLGIRVVRIMHPSGRHGWIDPEKTAIRKLYPHPDFEATIPLMELYYALPENAFPWVNKRHEDFRRRDLLRLLRHWWSEHRNAERFFEKFPAWRKKAAAKLRGPGPKPPEPEPPAEQEEPPEPEPPAPADFAVWKASLTPPEPTLEWATMTSEQRVTCGHWIFRRSMRGGSRP